MRKLIRQDILEMEKIIEENRGVRSNEGQLQITSIKDKRDEVKKD